MSLIVNILMLFVLTLFTILLLHIGRHSKSNIYLAIYFISQIIGILNYSVKTNIDILYCLGQSICFSWGALFYFYIVSLLKPNFKFRKITLLHFIPSIVAFILLLLTKKTHTQTLNNWNIDHSASILNITFNSLIIIYNIAAIYQYYIYTLESAQISSLKRNIPSLWLKVSLFGFAACCFIVQIGKISILNSFNWFTINNIVFLLYFCILFYISIVGRTLIGDYANSVKYKNSFIPQNEAQLILSKLKVEMEDNLLFTNPDINLKTTANILNISERTLSQIINEHLHQNFSEYINTYRIKYAMKLLSNPENKEMTMLSILFDSGFNSKTSFNITFKKIVGCTPIEYKKQKIG